MTRSVRGQLDRDLEGIGGMLRTCKLYNVTMSARHRKKKGRLGIMGIIMKGVVKGATIIQP